MEPTGRLLKHLNDLLKMELSYFRIMGVEINQNSLKIGRASCRERV